MKNKILLSIAVLGFSVDASANPINLGSLLAHEDKLEATKQRLAKVYRVSVPTINALTFIESSNKPRARSKAGAYGLMQIMGAHAGTTLCPEASQPEDLYHPIVNTICGVRILRYELDRHDDDLGLALAAYNGGPRCVRGQQILCKESRIHSERVLLKIARDLGN